MPKNLKLIYKILDVCSIHWPEIGPHKATVHNSGTHTIFTIRPNNFNKGYMLMWRTLHGQDDRGLRQMSVT